jgi:TolB-like protein/DNA-binding winged helix-turn-helix (wHTH) protein/Flp pilus assembly protein TadD
MPAEAGARKLRVDPSRYELSLDGEALRLERQPMELLLYLVSRRGQLVSREDIAGKLWGQEVAVDMDGRINAAVRKIRAALKEDPARPEFLETVVGKGYRFGGEVDLGPEVPVPLPAPVPPRGRGRLVALVGGLVIVAAAAGWGLQRQRQGGAAGRVHSIAVLPLANLSGDRSQDYLADALTEELTTDLAKIGSLRVVSRTSATSRGASHEPLTRIARELNVQTVVEGSVVRSGNHVRITAQLIDGETDRHLWAETYDRDMGDLLMLQNAVALEIARQVRARLTAAEQQRLDDGRPMDPAAYDAYLRGRYSQTTQSREALRAGLAAFQEAIAIDPRFAPAYAGLADSYSLLANYSVLPPSEAFPLSVAAARKSLELNPSLPEAHLALAFSEHHYSWEWEAARREYATALALGPSYPTAHLRYAEYLSSLGRHDEAIAEIHRAEDLDPLSPLYTSNAGRLLYHARRYDEAILELNKTLELDSTRIYTRLHMGMCYEQIGRYAEAEQQLEVVRAAFGGHPSIALAHLYAVTSRQQEARQIVDDMRSDAGDSDWFFLGSVYAALGDRDRAFDCLQQAYHKHDFFLVFAKIHPYMDPLRGDARFTALLRQIGLS